MTTTKCDFVNLHVHSQYSILDSIIRIPQLVSRIKELGMSTCALTDHGNLHGSIEFYKECKKQGVKPLLGIEAYISQDEDDKEKQDRIRDNFHMILLAMNQEGWKNLLWLSTRSYLNNFYYNPRISWTNLLNKNKGIIATSACLGGILAKETRIKEEKIIFKGGSYNLESKKFIDQYEVCKKRMLVLKEVFGDRFYVEIQHHPNMWQQAAYNDWVTAEALREHIEIVITSDAHYLHEYESSMQAIIAAQGWKKTLKEYLEKSPDVNNTNYYIHTPEQMWKIATQMGLPEAAENTLKISDRCNLDLVLGKYENPEIDITETKDYQEFLEWRKKYAFN